MAANLTPKSVREYIGARYVPVFSNPIEWSNTREYEPLTIVTYQGNSYTSMQYVPTGIDIDNTAFWALTGNYNAQIEQYRREVQNLTERYQVSTLNELKSSEIINGYVEVQGYSSMGDGGSGEYLILPSVPESMYGIPMINGNYAVYVPQDGVVNMKALGCGFSNDDSTLINEILNIAGYSNFYFPSGVYNIRNTIYVTRNNITISGETQTAPTANAESMPKGSVFNWTAGNSSLPIMLASTEKSMDTNTDQPIRGVNIHSISFNGNGCGYGLYVPFMAFSGYIDDIYAQGCSIAGIQIAEAWMLEIGGLYAWYNSIGIVLGYDYKNQQRNFFQVTVNYLNGHTSSAVPGTGISSMAGTGVIVGNTGAVNINTIDAEKNPTQGVFLRGYESMNINSMWLEDNILGGTINGPIVIGSMVLGQNDKIKCLTNVRIDSLNSNTGYYPFTDDTTQVVSVGYANYLLTEGQASPSWPALRKDFMNWGSADLISTNTSEGKYVFIPDEINSSLIIVPQETADINLFTVSVGTTVVTVPARNWVAGVPVILNVGKLGTDSPQAVLMKVQTASTSPLKFTAILASVRQFSDGGWNRFVEVM